MAYPTVTYTFSNSTTADATQVNQNFTDLINGLSDGTKDLSISALTVAGTATLNGAINLGNATSDDITITGYLASSFIPKTNQTYDIGTADLGLRALYLGVASAGALTAKVIASASIAADRIFTVPEAGTDASFVMTAGTQTISGAKTFDTAGNTMKGITAGSGPSAGYIGETLELTFSSVTAAATGSYKDTAGALALTAGKWAVSYIALLEGRSTSVSAGSNCTSYLYTTADSGSGVTPGVNSIYWAPISTTTYGAGEYMHSFTSPSQIINISSATNYYLNCMAQYGSTAPKWHGRLTAIRIG